MSVASRLNFRQNWPLVGTIVFAVVYSMVCLRLFLIRQIPLNRDEPFDYWMAATVPSGIGINWFYGGWGLLLFVIVMVLKAAFRRTLPKGFTIAFILAIPVILPVWLIFQSNSQHHSTLNHLESVTYNQHVYQLAMYEDIPVETSSWGVYEVFECDLSGNSCQRVKQLNAFPLGDYIKTAFLKVSPDDKTLFVQQDNEQVVIATKTPSS